mgnify:CR=1 FL=1
MVIKTEDFALDVDVQSTEEYYKTNTVCDCIDCRTFQVQAKQKFPLLTQFLEKFGVDISRPDELAAYDKGNVIYYDFVAYTVSGRILQADEYVFYITDSEMRLNIRINHQYIPNEQQSDMYFTVTVSGFRLEQQRKQPCSAHGEYSSVPFGKRFVQRMKQLFTARKASAVSPSMPKREEIVEMMYGMQLEAFGDKVVRVIYSSDRTMRYVILKDEKDLYTYQLEAIYQFDEEEWKYVSSKTNAVPAMWEPFHNALGSSIFSDEQDLLREMESEPEYKQYFS